MCAIACDKAGVRAYLLDEKANVMYAAMADGPLKDPNTLLRAHLEREVKVKGDLYTGPSGLKVVAVKEVQPSMGPLWIEASERDASEMAYGGVACMALLRDSRV